MKRTCVAAPLEQSRKNSAIPRWRFRSVPSPDGAPTTRIETMNTNFPLSTGQAARLLGTTEPRLAETVRRGRIHPEPTIVAGRRIWNREQLLQAAEHLGLLTDDVRAELECEVRA